MVTTTQLRGLSKRRFLDVIEYFNNGKVDLKNGLPENYKIPADAIAKGLTIYDFEMIATCYQRAHLSNAQARHYYDMLMKRVYAELRSTDITTNDESINETHDPRLDKLSQETLDKMETLIKGELDGEGNIPA